MRDPLLMILTYSYLFLSSQILFCHLNYQYFYHQSPCPLTLPTTLSAQEQSYFVWVPRTIQYFMPDFVNDTNFPCFRSLQIFRRHLLFSINHLRSVFGSFDECEPHFTITSSNKIKLISTDATGTVATQHLNQHIGRYEQINTYRNIHFWSQKGGQNFDVNAKPLPQVFLSMLLPRAILRSFQINEATNTPIFEDGEWKIYFFVCLQLVGIFSTQKAVTQRRRWDRKYGAFLWLKHTNKLFQSETFGEVCAGGNPIGEVVAKMVIVVKQQIWKVIAYKQGYL